ncbi:hypothetical protein IU469_37155, partial [Nocardia puris]|uniref:baeRF2 domain-containing protein n=1 Tax=Nocardia puris TaxID=208602 RepID=UPI00226BD3DE
SARTGINVTTLYRIEAAQARPQRHTLTALLDLYAVDENGGERRRTVRGEDHPVHKVPGGGWSHRTMQTRVEETTRRNLGEVAHDVEELAEAAHAEVIV